MPELDLLGLLSYTLSSIILVFIFPSTKRWQALLVSSLVFFFFLIGNDALFLLLFAAAIYGLSFWVTRYPSRTGLMIGAALLPLVLSKITGSDFYQHYTHANNNIALFQVIGISYFTFNSISYLIDIKRRYIQPEKNFLLLLLYLVYFPCIFSGPLHRAKYLMGQFKQVHITHASISSGLRLILLGLFKNIVISQRLLALKQSLQTTEISGIYTLLTGLLFFFYLYFNFSSFIDIFQGISTIFNIRLKNNFRNRIYLAYSRQDFWRGWHITLNEWFRDYFFFPLAKHDRQRKHVNSILLLTFFLIALWHEVSQAFILWGLMNGSWIILEKKANLEKLPYPQFRRWLGPVYHLGCASVLALVFISPDIHALFNKIFISPAHFPVNFIKNNAGNLALTLGFILLVDYLYAKAGELRFDNYLDKKPLISRWFIYFALTILILAFGITNAIDNYYVQF